MSEKLKESLKKWVIFLLGGVALLVFQTIAGSYQWIATGSEYRHFISPIYKSLDELSAQYLQNRTIDVNAAEKLFADMPEIADLNVLESGVIVVTTRMENGSNPIEGSVMFPTVSENDQVIWQCINTFPGAGGAVRCNAISISMYDIRN